MVLTPSAKSPPHVMKRSRVSSMRSLDACNSLSDTAHVQGKDKLYKSMEVFCPALAGEDFSRSHVFDECRKQSPGR